MAHGSKSDVGCAREANCRATAYAAFTLIELLVSSVLMVLVILLLSMTVSRVSNIWVRADSQISSFQSARFAFERMSQSLSQATLNPYLDYVDANGNRRTSTNAASFLPAGYGRMSDQGFCILPGTNVSASGATWSCFFQAPTGYATNSTLTPLDNLLNTVGFFVEFNNDHDPGIHSLKPDFISRSKWRFRLMMLMQPSEKLSVFLEAGRGWITSAMAPGPARQARPIGDNVIALVLQAKGNDGASLPGGSTFLYDSRDKASPNTLNQLPPRVEVTMVVIDEASADRLAAQNGTSPPALVKASYFQNPGSFVQDLRNLEDDLQKHPARPNYRIFNTTVRIEAAKWSD